MELALALDKHSKEALQAQIFDQLRGLILRGELHSGATVPPTRALAEQLAVSRNTIIHAYERLAADAISFAIARLRGLIDCMQQGQEPQQETTQLEEREMRVG